MRKLELVSIAWLLVLLQLAIANKVDGAGQAKPGCNDTCGNVTIKYPFGVGKDEKGHNCFLSKSFEVNCINGVPTLAIADLHKVFNISEIHFPNQVVLESYRIMAVDCTYTDQLPFIVNVSFDLASPFKVSAQANRYRAMGCDTTAYINNTGASFTSLCETQWMMSSGKKKQGGLGQCQIAVPGASRGYIYHVTDQFDYKKSACWRNCSYAVLADEEFEFSKDVLDSYLDKQSGVNTSIRFPLVAEWAIEDGLCGADNTSKTCGTNTWCQNTSSSESGYHCFCKLDCEGNPYLNDTAGCRNGDAPFPSIPVALAAASGTGSSSNVEPPKRPLQSQQQMRTLFPGGFKQPEIKVPTLVLQLNSDEVLRIEDDLNAVNVAVSKWEVIVMLDAWERSGGRLYEVARALKLVIGERAYLLIGERVDVVAVVRASGVVLFDQGW
ncbi:hypothetical protein MRB53_005413 [Persea americana]|uniref:Uncharacterized protein n=1 Tax=Persea americana TaxID=3435 RepID=A0ACC2MDF9_PERAE|nr:hypothetical protein MRB53_005413 [Persea americana]